MWPVGVPLLERNPLFPELRLDCSSLRGTLGRFRRKRRRLFSGERLASFFSVPEGAYTTLRILIRS